MDEKDRFGDKLRDAEKAREDQYFAERDRELVGKLKGASAAEVEAHLRNVARGRCPKCGHTLERAKIENVTVDECTQCHGLWLDKAELDLIAEREREGLAARWLRRITSG